MLTDQFLNLVCTTCISSNPLFTPLIASDCHDILTFYETQDEGIPLQSQIKFDLAKILAKLRSEGQKPDTVLENVRGSGKYKELDDFIVAISKTSKLDTADNAREAINQIDKKLKITTSMADFSRLKDFVENFESNGYDTIDQAFKAYESTVSGLYSRLSSMKRRENTTAVRSLDLFDGDYAPVLKQIKDNNSGKNVVPTGYKELDRYMGGGFQPGRLYIFSGTSNDGKSALLMNFIRNQLEKPETKVHDGDEYDIYLYITLENLIDESLVRLYSSVSNKKSRDITGNWENEQHNVRQMMREKQEKTKSRIIMEFFPATSISVHDIITLIQQTYEKHGDKGHIKGIFVDYLDLIRSGQKFDLYRLELGQVAIDLKCLAVTMQIPVVTVTQLNRSGYDKGERMSLGMMSESIKKVEHADFVGLLRSLEKVEDYKVDLNPDEGLLLIEIGKNRSGEKNRRIFMKTNFSKCLITDTGRETIIKLDEISGDNNPPLEAAFNDNKDENPIEEDRFAPIL